MRFCHAVGNQVIVRRGEDCPAPHQEDAARALSDQVSLPDSVAMRLYALQSMY